MDFVSSRIKNWLIGAGILVGLSFGIFGGGLQGFLTGLAGIVVPIICLGIFFALHLLGAGDIKLLCVIGSFIGPIKILYCMGTAILLGGVIGAIKLLICKGEEGRTTIRFAIPVLFSVLLQQGGFY